MKTSKQCPKCDSLRVGYLENRWQEDRGQGAAGPRSLPVGAVENQGLLFKYFEVAGELEAYLCADCGYFETYVKNPEDVAYEDLCGFQWLNPEAAEAGPYR